MAEKKQPKTQRQIDLLAALLRVGRTGISLRELYEHVPGYSAGARAETTVAMMFERDKEELRAMGFPLQVIEEEDRRYGGVRYRIEPRAMYMPYLELVSGDEAETADGFGTRSLGTVAFEVEEVERMLQGVRRLLQLGYDALAEHARSGLVRLGHDLPLEELTAVPELVRPEPAIDPDVIEALDDAVRRRKRCTFIYRGLDGAGPKERTVRPYRIAHLDGRWYLIAHDEAADAVRQFRLRRLSGLAVNGTRPQTPDFEVPDDFDASEHTRPRQLWQMGGEPDEQITVRFLESSGVTAPARQIGEMVEGDPQLRRYAVRRRAPFLHWVLGLAGGATIVAPADAAMEFRALVQSVSARHAAGATA